MPTTKHLVFNSNSHTENGYTYTFLDFEYSHLIIIKTIYSLKNKASIALFNESTRQSILKLNDYYTHTTRGLHVYSYSYRGIYSVYEHRPETPELITRTVEL